MTESVNDWVKRAVRAGLGKDYKNARKDLHCPEQSLFIRPMFSKINLALGTALVGIALCCFVESSLAQEALATPTTSSENDDVDRDDAGGKDDKSHRPRLGRSDSVVNAKSALLANG